MRRLVFLIAAIALIAVFVPSASAAPPDAADFAADCNDDGVVHVSGKHRYQGGTGNLAGDCLVTMDAGAKLVFFGVDLSGAGGLSVVTSPGIVALEVASPANTKIKIVDSTIAMAGPVELSAGCCAGEFDSADTRGRVVVRGSSITGTGTGTGTGVRLLASVDGDDGRVIVRNSLINAIEGGIEMRASDFGGNGHVRVKDSRLSALGDLVVRTGEGGTTIVVRNFSRIAGGAELSAGPGGRCQAHGNLPELQCGAADLPTDDGDGDGDGRDEPDVNF